MATQTYSPDAAEVRLLDVSDGTSSVFDLNVSRIFGLAAVDEGVVVLSDADGVSAFTPTGATLWELPGWPVPAQSGSLYVCSGEVETGSLVRIDPQTGEEQWRSDAPCADPIVHDSIATLITYDPLVDGGLILATVDLETGEVLRNEAFDDGTNDQVPGYDFGIGVGHLTVASGHQADFVTLDADGDEVLRLEERFGPPLGATDSYVILDRQGTPIAVDPATGEVRWEHLSQDQFIVSGDTIWSMERSAGELSRLDPQTGELLWPIDVGVSSSVSVSTSGSVAYVLTAFDVIALDIQSGAIVWSAPTPS